MKRRTIYLAVALAMGGLAAGANAEPFEGECGVVGGGKLGDITGLAKFGGSINLDGDGSISGAWFLGAPDGSQFHATDFNEIACFLDRVTTVFVLGTGIWNGEVVSFELTATDASPSDSMTLALLEVSEPFEFIVAYSGLVVRGHIKAKAANEPPRPRPECAPMRPSQRGGRIASSWKRGCTASSAAPARNTVSSS